jgi:large-conductance mechanosensitive channel
MKDFFKTLLWHDLLPLALAVYFGTVLQGFLESLVNHILVPLFDYIVAMAFGNLHLHDKKIVHLRDFGVQTVTLIIACAVLYFMIKLLMKYVESR